jgi:hypothetical protein
MDVHNRKSPRATTLGKIFRHLLAGACGLGSTTGVVAEKPDLIIWQLGRMAQPRLSAPCYTTQVSQRNVVLLGFGKSRNALNIKLVQTALTRARP